MSNSITAPVTIVQNEIVAPVTTAVNEIVAPVTTTGRDAYQLAVAGGFVGTRAEWLASLEGPQGPAGAEIVMISEEDYYVLSPEAQLDETKIYFIYETVP